MVSRSAHKALVTQRFHPNAQDAVSRCVNEGLGARKKAIVSYRYGITVSKQKSGLPGQIQRRVWILYCQCISRLSVDYQGSNEHMYVWSVLPRTRCQTSGYIVFGFRAKPNGNASSRKGHSNQDKLGTTARLKKEIPQDRGDTTTTNCDTSEYEISTRLRVG